MSNQNVAALIRSLYIAIPAFVLTFLTTLQTTAPENPRRMEIALVAAGIAAVTPFVARNIEGIVDTKRAEAGDVKPADVGYKLLPLATRQQIQHNEHAA